MTEELEYKSVYDDIEEWPDGLFLLALRITMIS